MLKTAVRDIRFMNELLPAAEREASALDDELPGPEHLLLAALAMGDSSARDALRETGASAELVKAAVLDVHRRALDSLGISEREPAERSVTVRGAYRATGAFDDVFRRAVALANTRPKSALRSAHVVLAITEQRSGTAVRALESLGIDLDTLADAARATLADR